MNRWTFWPLHALGCCSFPYELKVERKCNLLTTLVPKRDNTWHFWALINSANGSKSTTANLSKSPCMTLPAINKKGLSWRKRLVNLAPNLVKGYFFLFNPNLKSFRGSNPTSCTKKTNKCAGSVQHCLNCFQIIYKMSATHDCTLLG